MEAIGPGANFLITQCRIGWRKRDIRLGHSQALPCIQLQVSFAISITKPQCATGCKSIVMTMPVRLSVCLSNLTEFFVAVARSSSDGVVIRWVLPVFINTSCLRIGIGDAERGYIVKVTQQGSARMWGCGVYSDWRAGGSTVRGGIWYLRLPSCGFSGTTRRWRQSVRVDVSTSVTSVWRHSTSHCCWTAASDSPTSPPLYTCRDTSPDRNQASTVLQSRPVWLINASVYRPLSAFET